MQYKAWFGLCCGIIAFALFFLYDINSVCWKKKLLHKCFFVGSLLLAAATVFQAVFAIGAAAKGIRFWACMVLAVLSLILLADTLFFELPFEETYLDTNEKPKVYDRGMYALCRHPGVIWFFFFYIFLGAAVLPEKLLYIGIFYSMLNLLYVIFQDVWTFPRTFDDYSLYKKSTPFLLPSISSLKKAVKTSRHLQEWGA